MFRPAKRSLINRFSQTMSCGTHRATYDYLDHSPLVGQITFDTNGTTVMTTTNGYDHLNRLTHTASLGGTGSTRSQFDYQYNPASQRPRVTHLDGSYWVYGYDSMGQVTSGRKYWGDGTAIADSSLITRLTTLATGRPPRGMDAKPRIHPTT